MKKMTALITIPKYMRLVPVKKMQSEQLRFNYGSYSGLPSLRPEMPTHDPAFCPAP